jgi:hypothetical protein
MFWQAFIAADAAMQMAIPHWPDRRIPVIRSAALMKRRHITSMRGKSQNTDPPFAFSVCLNYYRGLRRPLRRPSGSTEFAEVRMGRLD